MILDNEKSKFLHILVDLNKECKNLYTQQELSTYLKVSRKKIVDFQKGRIFDFWLLCRYADILGVSIDFNLKNSH